MVVDDAAIVRFRALIADLHSATGAVREVERRLNDWRASALLDLNREIALVEPSTRSIYLTVSEKSKQRLAQLRTQVAEVQEEIARLEAERDRLRQRRDVASQLACRCRDFLRERDAPHRCIASSKARVKRAIADRLAERGWGDGDETATSMYTRTWPTRPPRSPATARRGQRQRL